MANQTTVTSTSTFNFKSWYTQPSLAPLTDGTYQGTITSWEDRSTDDKGCIQLHIKLSDRNINPCFFGIGVKIMHDELRRQLGITEAFANPADAFNAFINTEVTLYLSSGVSEASGNRFFNYNFAEPQQVATVVNPF